MVRISFRQGMLAGFLLIVVLLGGAALRSWLVVEHFVEQSRRGNEQALQVSTSLQELSERTVDVERSARQYLVLDDPGFRLRFSENLAQALAAVDRLDALAAPPLAPLLGQWRSTAEALRAGMAKPLAKAELMPLLARLGELNGQLDQAGRRWLAAQNDQVLSELEANRLHLTAQIVGALVGAFLVATAVGWWLVWPIRSLEQAIGRLGESRFDAAVAIGGPMDLRRLGRRLDWLRQRLADLEADRERTLRHVSHELKTPLTALREGVALLREEVPGPLGEAQHEVVDILQHNVLGLQERIESLLRLNAAAFDARRLCYQPVVLGPFLAEAAGRWELQLNGRLLRLSLAGPATSVSLDREKMAVVVDNLLSNAIDFSPEGGEIRLQAAVGDGWLVLDCIDQGPGVAAADAEKIFDPFVQGRRPAPAPRRGSGVGLSIVRELVRAMGGSVSLVPGDGGAHFRVRVPDERDEVVA